MAKKFNLKVLIIILATVIILVSATGFSVSYAKWVTGANATLSANLSIGKWRDITLSDLNINGGEKGYSQPVVDELKKDITPPSGLFGSSVLYGGIIFINKDGKVSTAWRQGTFYNGNKPYGYTTDYIEMVEGTKFIICSFSRVVDPNNAIRKTTDDGYAIIKGDISFVNYTDTDEDSTNDNRVIFEAKEDGYYKFDVREGTNISGMNSSGYPDNYDIITIEYKKSI